MALNGMGLSLELPTWIWPLLLGTTIAANLYCWAAWRRRQRLMQRALRSRHWRQPTTAFGSTALRLETARREAIDRLPTHVVRTGGEGGDAEISSDGSSALSRVDECCLCMEAMRGGEVVRTLPCSHHFHSQCIDKWLFEAQRWKSRSCPLCMSDPLQIAIQIEMGGTGAAHPGGEPAAQAVAEPVEAVLQRRAHYGRSYLGSLGAALAGLYAGSLRQHFSRSTHPEVVVPRGTGPGSSRSQRSTAGSSS